MEDRIKNIRKHFGLTQSEFGQKIGVKGNTITGYESGVRSPSDAVIISICREFNVDENWLRTGNGNMFRQDSQSVLDRMTDEYSLTRRERAVISAFLELDSADRAAVMRYVDNLVDKLAPTSAAVDDATAAGIAAMQDYANMVAEEKDTEAESSASAG